MVPAQHQGDHILVERFRHSLGQALAGLRDFVQISGALFAIGMFFRLRDDHVADVFHLTAKLFESCVETSYTQRRRAHVHAAAALSQVHRHADDSYFFWHFSVSFAVLWRGRPTGPIPGPGTLRINSV